MIIVTGTKRAGTSMWMQILHAAGLPVIGKDFAEGWGPPLRQANPRGFYESRLRQGIWHATNPDPRTGAYLHPAETRKHAIKVFAPGVVRTDAAFLHRVLITLRDWRTHTASMERLHALEDASLRDRPLRPGEEPARRAERLARFHARRDALPPAAHWWFEVFDLLRDAQTRRYPVHVVTYDRLLADPPAEVERALRWMGAGDPAAGARAVAPELRTQTPLGVLPPDGFGPDDVDVMDALFDALHQHRSVPAPLLRAMNAAHLRLSARFHRRPKPMIDPDALPVVRPPGPPAGA